MARLPWNETIYRTAEEFRQRCLVDTKSFLWPEHDAWTISNLQRFWAAFVGRPDERDVSFIEKWRDQLSDQPDDVIRAAVDVAALYGLFPAQVSIRPSTKKDLVLQVRDFRPEVEYPDKETWNLLMDAFEHRGVGRIGTHYNTGRPYQMAFYIGFALHLKEEGIDPYDWHACRDAADIVRERVKAEYGQTPSLARNIILHLLFPEHFEDTSSDDHKQRMFRALAEDAGVNLDTDVDEGIQVIRAHLAETLDKDVFNFYDPDIRGSWDSAYSTPQPEEDSGSAPGSAEAPESLPSPPPSGDTFLHLSHTVFLPEPFLEELNDLLLAKRQLIFEGPPGSGKTFVAEKFARWFTGQPVDGETPLDEHVEIVQFHQSYGYEDFVQGIRPETNDGHLVYRVRDGIFLDMVERAKANPDDRFVLIIDEINRGNLSRIFGELLLLLEYRNQSVRLPYGSGDSGYLSIPKNLHLIGTMNTADRSLSQIDYALRRRFYFVRLMPVEDGRAEVFERWLAENVSDPADRSRLANLFVRLNDGIGRHLGTDDLQVGHSYFMQPGIETPAVFDRIWRRAVKPLLMEYLHHHRNRDEILTELLVVTRGEDEGAPVDDGDMVSPDGP